MKPNKPLGSSETRVARPSFKPNSQIGKMAEDLFANTRELTWFSEPKKEFGLISRLRSFFGLNSNPKFEDIKNIKIDEFIKSEFREAWEDLQKIHNQGQQIRKDFTAIGDTLGKEMGLSFTVRSSYDSYGAPTEAESKATEMTLAKGLKIDKMDFAKDMISAILGRHIQLNGSISDEDIKKLKENVIKLKDIDINTAELDEFIESEQARIKAADPSDASKTSIIHKLKTTKLGGTKRDTGWRIW